MTLLISIKELYNSFLENRRYTKLRQKIALETCRRYYLSHYGR